MVIVHRDNGLPVVGDLLQVERLADVDEVEDVLLEARPAKAHGGLKELGSDSGILSWKEKNAKVKTRFTSGAHKFTNGPGDLADVRAGDFADGRDGVDAGDPLREESVGHQLGELRGPRVHRQNFLCDSKNCYY